MNGRHIGIDRRGNTFYAVEVDFDAGRPSIVRFYRGDTSPAGDEAWAGDTSIAVTVPDDLAIVKAICPGSGQFPSVEDRLRFELGQSLLEDESVFHFLIQPTGNERRYLGAALRRHLLSELRSGYGLEEQTDADPVYQLRSFALGRGYLNFCRRESGDLIALVDLCHGRVSVCLVYRDQIVDVISLKPGEASPDAPEARDRLAVDLKTVVNFRLAGLMEAGVTVPVSSLLITGQDVDPSLIEAVRRYFKVNIGQPAFHEGCFAGQDLSDPAERALYLAALGSTVK
jgi:hypothetical protein